MGCPTKSMGCPLKLHSAAWFILRLPLATGPIVSMLLGLQKMWGDCNSPHTDGQRGFFWATRARPIIHLFMYGPLPRKGLCESLTPPYLRSGIRCGRERLTVWSIFFTAIGAAIETHFLAWCGRWDAPGNASIWFYVKRMNVWVDPLVNFKEMTEVQSILWLHCCYEWP